MGCGCNKARKEEEMNGSNNPNAGAAQPAQAARKIVPSARQQAPAPVGSSSYDDPMACYRCYIKHLSKASVEAAEVAEDVGRAHELSQCIGNMACAEDHAAALGLQTETEVLRSLRNRVWSADRSVPKELLDMAASAVVSLRRIEREADERAKREWEERERERKAREEIEASDGKTGEPELKPDA